MDFFAHQDAARKQTGRLVMLFALAVAGIIAMVYIVALIFLGVTGSASENLDTIDHAYQNAGDLSAHDAGGAPPAPAMSWFRPDVFCVVSIGVLAVVGLATLSKMAQLRGGGARVAEGLGGRLLTHDTADPLEKRVLNVVEEMAIASGIPAPPVYVMDKEAGINAFAAGWSPADAVIGVTRGCLETLDRDELQGVMAHEFSHILNGDMRLNIRLMGIVFGILVIHIIGRMILRYGMLTGHRSRNEKGGGAAAAMMLAGLSLAIIGGLGSLFGSMIRASVSRQREFLADASAVQFTRNPSGIAGALKKIGGYSAHSRIATPAAEESSHMFFSSAMLSGISGLFATHPPLPERIRRIEPDWDGKMPAIEPSQRASTRFDARASGFTSAEIRPQTRTTAASAVDWIGRVGPMHVQRAEEILASIPGALVQAAREPYTARAVALALLLDRDDAIRARQLDRIRETGDRGLLEETTRYAPQAMSVGADARGALAEIAVGAMSGMTRAQWTAFRSVLTGIVEADARRNVFEWMLERLVDRALGARFNHAREAVPEYDGLNRLGAECSMVLSILACAGSRETESIRRAFAAGAGVLGDQTTVTLLPPERCSLSALGAALAVLSRVSPQLKKTLIIACAKTIAADGRADAAEIELLRGVCASLGAPMPPVLPGQRLVA